MCRIVKPTGYIYVNAPSASPYHMYPGDNWRFYSDAGQTLAYWSGKQISDEKIFPVKVIETFTIVNNEFNDFVCVWQRVDSDSEIIVQPEIITPTEKKNETKNKLCYENDIMIKVYNKMNREVILPDQRTIS